MLNIGACYHRAHKKKNLNKAVQEQKNLDNSASASNASCIVEPNELQVFSASPVEVLKKRSTRKD